MTVARLTKPRLTCPTCKSVFLSYLPSCPNDGANLETSKKDPLEGTDFADRYIIEECIGEGGMGRVYRARHQRVSRRFAVKVLFGDFATDPTMRTRFTREAEAASRLDHPNLVSVVDFGETGMGQLYLVMDYAEGQTLADRIIKSGAMEAEQVARLTRHMASGLAHAHDKELVHRDFKSDNVIVVSKPEGDEARIVDFGLAVPQGPDQMSSRLTAHGLVMGTAEYMSPEQAVGYPLDRRTDLFSLGIVLYEMLAGVLPFDGTSQEVIKKNLQEQPPPIAQRVPGLQVDPELEKLAFWLMRKKRSHRPQDGSEVIKLLDARDAQMRAMRAGGAAMGESPSFSGGPSLQGGSMPPPRAGTMPPIHGGPMAGPVPNGGMAPRPGTMPPIHGGGTIPPGARMAGPPAGALPGNDRGQWGGPPVMAGQAATRSKMRTSLIVVAILGIVAAVAVGAVASQQGPGDAVEAAPSPGAANPDDPAGTTPDSPSEPPEPSENRPEGKAPEGTRTSPASDPDSGQNVGQNVEQNVGQNVGQSAGQAADESTGTSGDAEGAPSPARASSDRSGSRSGKKGARKSDDRGSKRDRGGKRSGKRDGKKSKPDSTDDGKDGSEPGRYSEAAFKSLHGQVSRALQSSRGQIGDALFNQLNREFRKISYGNDRFDPVKRKTAIKSMLKIQDRLDDAVVDDDSSNDVQDY